MQPAATEIIVMQGDIMIVEDHDGGIIVGVADRPELEGQAVRVVWGDTFRIVLPTQSHVIPKPIALPSMGQFIGVKFKTHDECRAALIPHVRGTVIG